MKGIVRFVVAVVAVAFCWQLILRASGHNSFAMRSAQAQQYTDAQVDEYESQMSATITSQLSAKLGIPVICRVHVLAGMQIHERCDLTVPTDTISPSDSRAMEREFIAGSCEDPYRRKALDNGIIWKFQAYSKAGVQLASATASRSACVQ